MYLITLMSGFGHNATTSCAHVGGMDYILHFVVAAIGFAIFKLTVGGALRDLRDLVQFNIQGANPMVRLVPNICFTLLFVLLCSLTMGGLLVSTTVNLTQ